jgi:hypothetical protein
MRDHSKQILLFVLGAILRNNNNHSSHSSTLIPPVSSYYLVIRYMIYCILIFLIHYASNPRGEAAAEGARSKNTEEEVPSQN